MVETEFERVVTIPLRSVYEGPRVSYAPTTIQHVRRHLARHFKVDPADVYFANSLNELVWKHGRHNIPRRLKVKVTKFAEDRRIEVWPYAEEGTVGSRRAAKDSARSKGEETTTPPTEAESDDEGTA